MFDTGQVSAPAFDPMPESSAPGCELWPEQGTHFDDTDGAYSVAEPDPFETLPTSRPAYPSLRAGARLSLRAEIGPATARGVSISARLKSPSLPVTPGLRSLLPGGLRRGSTIAVTSSISLLLALLGPSSAEGAWAALIGMPTISAEAAAEAGLELSRLAVITPPPEGSWNSATWVSAVGALLDAVDIVVARPGVLGTRMSDGEARRITARARSKDAVLVLFGQHSTTWPALEVTLSAQHGHWSGIGTGQGRITGRRLSVSAAGRGRSARGDRTELWLPEASRSPASCTTASQAIEEPTVVPEAG
jgi:hypothetical protein